MGRLMITPVLNDRQNSHNWAMFEVKDEEEALEAITKAYSKLYKHPPRLFGFENDGDNLNNDGHLLYDNGREPGFWDKAKNKTDYNQGREWNIRIDRFAKIALNKTEKPNPSGYIIETMEAVFYALNTSKDFESSIVKVVNLGGDSDTTGAICGAIAGASYGYSNIPERWLEKIQKPAELEDVSVKLYELGKKL